jgi:hypothetical protein
MQYIKERCKMDLERLNKWANKELVTTEFDDGEIKPVGTFMADSRDGDKCGYITKVLVTDVKDAGDMEIFKGFYWYKDVDGNNHRIKIDDAVVDHKITWDETDFVKDSFKVYAKARDARCSCQK